MSVQTIDHPASGGAFLSRILQHAAMFATFVGLWEASVRMGWVSELILPSPIAMVYAWVNLSITTGLIWPHFFVTLWEVVAGFALGVVLGGGIATVCALSPVFRRLISPYMVALQVTPRIAVAPIIVAWLGFNTEPKIAIAVIICFFPIFVNTLTGLMQVDREALEMFKSLRANRWQVFAHLMLPSAMPVIMAGLKTAVGLALIGAIVGEFVSASVGMGVLVQKFSFQLMLPEAFAVLMTLTFMGLLLYFLMELVDSRVIYWTHDRRLSAMSQRKAKAYRAK